MKQLVFFLTLTIAVTMASAQTKSRLTLQADSVDIHNYDSAELIIQNHTQNVPGFLFNTGNGRTQLKHVLVGISDSVYLIS